MKPPTDGDSEACERDSVWTLLRAALFERRVRRNRTRARSSIETPVARAVGGKGHKKRNGKYEEGRTTAGAFLLALNDSRDLRFRSLFHRKIKGCFSEFSFVVPGIFWVLASFNFELLKTIHARIQD